jgi:hypothetical protein
MSASNASRSTVARAAGGVRLLADTIFKKTRKFFSANFFPDGS